MGGVVSHSWLDALVLLIPCCPITKTESGLAHGKVPAELMDKLFDIDAKITDLQRPTVSHEVQVAEANIALDKLSRAIQKKEEGIFKKQLETDRRVQSMHIKHIDMNTCICVFDH